VGGGSTDFLLEAGAPVDAVLCLSGPTAPRPSCASGEFSWRLISHLTPNYMSLVDDDEGASRLREVLRLYSDLANPGLVKQIEGLVGIAARPTVRRIQTSGHMGFARGLETIVSLDESRFTGTGAFLMGAVLAQFLARYVSINSFTETVIKTVQRGEIVRWQPEIGRRQTL
jgi:type VI secretion system protein ImpG